MKKLMKTKNKVISLLLMGLLLTPYTVKADIAAPSNTDVASPNTLSIVLICLCFGILISLIGVIVILMINKGKNKKTV